MKIHVNLTKELTWQKKIKYFSGLTFIRIEGTFSSHGHTNSLTVQFKEWIWDRNEQEGTNGT